MFVIFVITHSINLQATRLPHVEPHKLWSLTLRVGLNQYPRWRLMVWSCVVLVNYHVEPQRHVVGCVHHSVNPTLAFLNLISFWRITTRIPTDYNWLRTSTGIIWTSTIVPWCTLLVSRISPGRQKCPLFGVHLATAKSTCKSEGILRIIPYATWTRRMIVITN
jgi:hypothetical protein